MAFLVPPGTVVFVSTHRDVMQMSSIVMIGIVRLSPQLPNAVMNLYHDRLDSWGWLS